MFTVKKRAQIASTEFELQVKRFLESTSGKLEEFKTEHLESIEGPDGTYEIDITARFRILGAKFLVLVECKHHKNRVGATTCRCCTQNRCRWARKKQCCFLPLVSTKGR